MGFVYRSLSVLGVDWVAQLYEGYCWVLVRKDNGYPLAVYGADQEDRARHIAEKNDCGLVKCMQEEKRE